MAASPRAAHTTPTITNVYQSSYTKMFPTPSRPASSEAATRPPLRTHARIISPGPTGTEANPTAPGAVESASELISPMTLAVSVSHTPPGSVRT